MVLRAHQKGIWRVFAYAVVCTLTVVLLLVSSSPAHADAKSAYAAGVSQSAFVTRQTLNEFMGLTPHDTFSYAHGVWNAPGSHCWWCLDEVATAAAVLSRQTAVPDSGMLNAATSTIDSAISTYQHPDGSWDESDIVTGFYAEQLGITYFTLQDVLSPRTRTSWIHSMSRAATYIAAHDLTWCVNGNVNLRDAAVLWMAWRMSGNTQFHTDFDSEWAFTMSPPQKRWPGFGLRISKTPATASYSDGAGYLAEQGAGAPGFDPGYTMTQLDDATEMWVVSHDQRWLRLMNLFFNRVRPRINMTTFSLDATGGSRHSLVEPFYSAGLAVLANSGGRTDLQRYVSSDLTNIEAQFTKPGDLNQNMYRGLSGWLAIVQLDSQRPTGAINPPPSQPMVSKRTTGSHAGLGSLAGLRITVQKASKRTLLNSGVRVTLRSVPRGTRIEVQLLARRVPAHPSGQNLVGWRAPFVYRTAVAHLRVRIWDRNQLRAVRSLVVQIGLQLRGHRKTIRRTIALT